MARNKEIIIDIDQDGNSSVNGEGFIDSGCEKFIKEINNIIGTKISIQRKKEYYGRRINHNKRLERNR